MYQGRPLSILVTASHVRVVILRLDHIPTNLAEDQHSIPVTATLAKVEGRTNLPIKKHPMKVGMRIREESTKMLHTQEAAAVDQDLSNQISQVSRRGD